MWGNVCWCLSWYLSEEWQVGSTFFFFFFNCLVSILPCSPNDFFFFFFLTSGKVFNHSGLCFPHQQGSSDIYLPHRVTVRILYWFEVELFRTEPCRKFQGPFYWIWWWGGAVALSLPQLFFTVLVLMRPGCRVRFTRWPVNLEKIYFLTSSQSLPFSAVVMGFAEPSTLTDFLWSKHIYNPKQFYWQKCCLHNQTACFSISSATLIKWVQVYKMFSRRKAAYTYVKYYIFQ